MSVPKTLGEVLSQGWIPDGNGGFSKAPKAVMGIPITGVEREADLHEQIFSECRRRGWIAFHGSMAERTHRTEGENDFHCLLPGGIVLFIECKRHGGKLSPAQFAMSHWMEKLGHKMHVVRSFDEFSALCDSALNHQPVASKSL